MKAKTIPQKPTIKLTPLEKTVVSTPTEQERETLKSHRVDLAFRSFHYRLDQETEKARRDTFYNRVESVVGGEYFLEGEESKSCAEAGFEDSTRLGILEAPRMFIGLIKLPLYNFSGRHIQDTSITKFICNQKLLRHILESQDPECPEILKEVNKLYQKHKDSHVYFGGSIFTTFHKKGKNEREERYNFLVSGLLAHLTPRSFGLDEEECQGLDDAIIHAAARKVVIYDTISRNEAYKVEQSEIAEGIEARAKLAATELADQVRYGRLARKLNP